MPIKRVISFLSICFICTIWARAQVVINEMMQSNVDCVMDDLNEFPDSWVELYNTSETPINLSMYRIGVTPNIQEAWPLPSLTLEGHGYMMLYCDKVGNGAHTPFRLESGKNGSIYLFVHGEMADQWENLDKQPAPNIAFGRKTDGHEERGYLTIPTPNAPNCGEISDLMLGNPIFSVEGKVITDSLPVTLYLSLPEHSPEGCLIRYTTDGSEPTNGSIIYDSPLIFDTTTVVRAKLFCEGALSPRSTTHSYIFFPRFQKIPVISLVTDDAYFYDEKQGIYVEGAYSPDTANYVFDWRRPVNMEMFVSQQDNSVINQLCEIRNHGGATRKYPLKSLNVYAHKRFGKKQFKYAFFPEQKPDKDQFKSLVLRNAGNDYYSLYLRDAIIQSVMGKHVAIDWQAYRPSIIFINGKYKGILNIRERANEDYVYTNYDGLENVDVIENLWGELKHGSSAFFWRFVNFYSERGHTLDEYAQWIDWSEFADIMVMNLYFNNQDFPGNNVVLWRPSDGGVFRLIALDTDFGMGLSHYPADYNTIQWLYDPTYDRVRNWGNYEKYTRLFRYMMEDEDFRKVFIDRATVYMGDFLNGKGVHSVWDKMYEDIQDELPFHQSAAGIHVNYQNEMNFAADWIAQRTGFFYDQLADFYQLGKPRVMAVNKSLHPDILANTEITVNDIPLSAGVFDGKYYQGREFSLKASGNSDTPIEGWKIVIKKSDHDIEVQDIPSEQVTMEMPDCQSFSADLLIAGQYTPGDVNGDGVLNIVDVMMTVNSILGIVTNDISISGDLDKDGNVNVVDAMRMVGIILGTTSE